MRHRHPSPAPIWYERTSSCAALMMNPHAYFEPRKQRQQEEEEQPPPSHATLTDNIDRTMFFLKLANEQIRIVSPATADFIDYHHIKGLRQQFNFALTLNKSRHDSAASLTTIDHLPEIQRKTSPAPSGLGGGVLEEMSPAAAAFVAPWNRNQTSTSISPPTQSQLSELVQDSEPLGRARRYVTQDLLEGSEPLDDERDPRNPTFYRPISRPHGNLSMRSRFDARVESCSSISTASEEGIASSSRSAISPPTTVLELPEEAPTSSRISWANVASTATSSQVTSINNQTQPKVGITGRRPSFPTPGISILPVRNADRGRTATVSSSSTTSSISKPAINISVTPPTPAFILEDYRALFITELPANITLHRISQRIVGFGPLASIHLQKDVDETIPGRSACIIFLTDANARAFLLANKHINDVVDLATFSWPPSIEPHYAGLLSRVAPDSYIIPAAPVQPNSDNDLASMLSPVYARRRLKFTRSKLFHTIDIPQFKRDVLSILGVDKTNHKDEVGKYVELWHFYNSGECTVVFASVKVARLVNTEFRKWTRGKGENGAGFRYKGVECAFAHDFNEEPGQKMYTTYEWEVGCGPEAESQWVGRGAKGKGKVVYKAGATVVGSGPSMGQGVWKYKCRGQAACQLWEGPPAWEE